MRSEKSGRSVPRSLKLQAAIQKEINESFPEVDLLVPRVPVPFFIDRVLMRYILPPALARLYTAVEDGLDLPRSSPNFYHYIEAIKDALDSWLEPQQKKSWLYKLRRDYYPAHKRKRRSRTPPLYVWMPLTYAQEKNFAILYNPFNTISHVRRRDARGKRVRASARELRALRAMEDNPASLDAAERAKAGRPFDSRPRARWGRRTGGGTVCGEKRETPQGSDSSGGSHKV